MSKKTFERPVVNVISFTQSDIICTSAPTYNNFEEDDDYRQAPSRVISEDIWNR